MKMQVSFSFQNGVLLIIHEILVINSYCSKLNFYCHCLQKTDKNGNKFNYPYIDM